MNIDKWKEWMAFAQNCGEGDVWDQIFDGKAAAMAQQKTGKLERPAVDVYRTDSEITVVAELPGMRKEDLSLSVSGTVLHLRGEARKPEWTGDIVQSERFAGAFERQIVLPAPVDSAVIAAGLTDGLLTIRFRTSGNTGEPILLD